MQQIHFLGPPGTGKTTRLMQVVEDEMAAGVRPDRIAFISFTTKATDEAITRAVDRFGFSRGDMPYFRTLHSIAYRELGLRKSDVISREQYRQLGGLVGWEISGYTSEGDGAVGGKQGDQLLFMNGLARNRLITDVDLWRDMDNQFSIADVQLFNRTYDLFRRDVGVVDFTDMLEHYVRQGAPLDIDVAIIDEAQDMSALQWRAVWLAVGNAARVYTAGDDDQAIYEWSGADVAQFLSLQGERHVLGHSYRLPRNIFDVAAGLAQRISRRYEKTWEPVGAGGLVQYHTEPGYVPDMDGDWLLLARNNYMLTGLREWAHDNAIIYEYRGKASVDPLHVQAIKCWERLRNGGTLTREQAAVVLEHIKLGHGVAKRALPPSASAVDIGYLRDWNGLTVAGPWYIALTNIAEASVTYYRRVLATGRALDSPVRARISAIHGAKGGQADNVMLLTDMGRSSYDTLLRNPDSEHRVFYVGASRARRSLHVVQPSTSRFYGV